MRLRHELSIIESWIGRLGVNSWQQTSSRLCHSQLFLAGDFAVQKTLSPPALMFKLRRHDVTPSTGAPIPPELHTQSWTHENMDIPSSFEHQSSDMFSLMNLHATDTRPLLLFMLLVLFPPTHLYCKSLPSPQRLSNDTQALISGGALLYATPQTCQELPVLVVIFAPYFHRVWRHHFWIGISAKHLA